MKSTDRPLPADPDYIHGFDNVSAALPRGLPHRQARQLGTRADAASQVHMLSAAVPGKPARARGRATQPEVQRLLVVLQQYPQEERN